MIPAPFEYARAGSVEEAISLLGSDPDAKILAGGHSLLPAMRLRVARPSMLVDIGRIAGLSYVREDGDRLAIGALTRHHDVANAEALQQLCPIVAHAAGQIGDPQVRHMGTIGGSVAHGDPAGDLPAVLLALDAEFVAQGPNGTRTVAATDFFTSLFETALAPDEVLTEIRSRRRTRVELHEVPAAGAGLGRGRRLRRPRERRGPRGPDEHGAHTVARGWRRGGGGGARTPRPPRHARTRGPRPRTMRSGPPSTAASW